MSPSVVNSIPLNAQLELTIEASDPDAGDLLSYSWQASLGSFVSNDSSVVHWTAPQVADSTQIVVSVSDGQASVEDTLVFNVVQNAFLQGGDVSPGNGSVSDSYLYQITFTDPADNAPKTAEVFVDGTTYTMSQVSGSFSSGAVYQFQSSLLAGAHEFSFRFVDILDSVILFPTGNYLVGPSVTEDQSTVIEPDVAVIDKLDSLSLSNISGTTFTFAYTGTPPQFDVGDIIVGSDSAGYLRKIVSSSSQNGTLTIITEDASLVDVISKGTLDTTFALPIGGSNKSGKSSYFQEVYMAPGVSVRAGRIDLSDVVLFSGSAGPGNLTAKIAQGSVGFEPDFRIRFDIENNQITEFEAVASGTIYFDCDFELNATASFTKSSEITIASFRHVQTQFIGYVPVVEVITVSFYAGFEAEAHIGGSTTFGFTDTSSVGFGARYQNNSWSPVWEKSNVFVPHSPSWQAEAGVGVRGYIKPRLDVELYAVTGPYLEIIPYAAFDGTVTANPVCWNWDLYAGIEGNLGFQAHILDIDLLDYDTTLLQYQITLASDSDCVGLAPEVTTSPVTAITQTTATCGGNVTSDGGATVTARGVCWSTNPNPTISGDKTIDGSDTGIYVSSITGLTQGTNYHVRAYATNSEGTDYGEDKPFTTDDDPIGLPEVTTNSVTAITQTNAICGGNVTSDGGATVSARGVCWSTSQNPTVADSKTTNGTETGSFISSITGLTADTPYYVRAYATNSTGTGYGNEVSFTSDDNTDTDPPSAISDIEVISTTQTSLTFQWTAPGDDGMTGTATEYDIRFSTLPINETTWLSATQATGEPDPLPGGSTQTWTLTDRTPDVTYRVAIKTRDEADNWSDLSNEAIGTTENGDSTGTVEDRDGNVYKTIKIGDQWWMAENLKVTQYRNGNAIPNVTDDSTWANLFTGAYCAYDNNTSNVATYGLLYNWFTIKDSRYIAPEGWHVPTDEEWKQLEMYLGMSQAEADGTDYRGTDEGGKLKEAGTTHWTAPNTGATNESGFSALPGGTRYNEGSFVNIGSFAYFLSSTEYFNYNAWFRVLSYDYSSFYRYFSYASYGFSVRCVKD